MGVLVEDLQYFQQLEHHSVGEGLALLPVDHHAGLALLWLLLIVQFVGTQDPFLFCYALSDRLISAVHFGLTESRWSLRDQ